MVAYGGANHVTRGHVRRIHPASPWPESAEKVRPGHDMNATSGERRGLHPGAIPVVILVLTACVNDREACGADGAVASHVADTGWPARTAGCDPGRSQISGVAMGPDGEVLALSRGQNHWMPNAPLPRQKLSIHPVLAIDASTGELDASWGAGMFVLPHQIVVDHSGNVWVVDVGLHQVVKCDARGKRLLTVGGPTVRFNMPTDVAFFESGEFVVSDGYANSRIVRFTADGKPLATWGENGTGPLQFRVPHSVTVDDQDRVYVADRENGRIQVLSRDGEFLAAWGDVDTPITVRFAAGSIFVLSNLEADKGIVRRLNLRGEVLESFRTKPPGTVEDFAWPHGLAVSRDGNDVYAGFTLTGRRIVRYRRPAP